MLSTNTGLSPFIAELSISFLFLHIDHWPGPRSLATTNGVSVDFLSSGYLDVSVHQVCLTFLCIQKAIPHMWWVSPFGHPRIKGYSHLPVAYRSVLRPSSPLSAKASTRCPFALDFLFHTQVSINQPECISFSTTSKSLTLSKLRVRSITHIYLSKNIRSKDLT